MYNVYWMLGDVAKSKEFPTSEMKQALEFTESLRNQRLAGEDIKFVTMASEHPDCVGKQGYDVTGPDYNWKKRRI